MRFASILLLLLLLPACEPVAERSWQLWFTRDAGERVDTALCSWLDEARSSLDLAAFELDLPCVESSLRQARDRGVSVRLVVDSENESPQLAALTAAGIPI